MRTLLIFIVLSSTAVAETRLTVTADRPFRGGVNTTHRDEYRQSHSFEWNLLPRNTYLELTVRGTDASGLTATESVRLNEGESKTVCLRFPAPQPSPYYPPAPIPAPPPHRHDCDDCDPEPAAICDLCSYWWLLLGLGSAFILCCATFRLLDYRLRRDELSGKYTQLRQPSPGSVRP